MTTPGPTPDTIQTAALTSARTALRGVCLALPHLSGLSHEVRLQVDARCPTAGVFASGRLLVNPEWWLDLKPAEALFVMAHELLHLALDTHGRRGDEDHWLVNVAHDYVINDILEQELEMETPANGLRSSGASYQSLEWWVGYLKREQSDGSPLPSAPFGAAGGSASRLGNLGKALEQALGEPEGPTLTRGDVFSDELERDWFPGEAGAALQERRHIVRAAATRASSLGVLRRTFDRTWRDHNLLLRVAGLESESMSSIETAYQAPWELALQRWFDGVGPATRSYQRASRRGAEREDGVILPGRKREGWTLHLVLDTSGSMYHLLRGLLGVIASFAEANHIDQIHLVQADGHEPVDEWIETGQLREVELRGFGDGDLVAPLEHLARDADVQSVIVVTDAYEPYPAYPPPFEVLWTLPAINYDFVPGYGTIIVLPAEVWSY